MTITQRAVAGGIADYLRHRVTQAQLVDWAFGLTWADCAELLGRPGFSARVEIVTG